MLVKGIFSERVGVLIYWGLGICIRECSFRGCAVCIWDGALVYGMGC